MIGNGERVGRRRRDGPGRVAWTAAVALLVAVPVAAAAQVQPPPSTCIPTCSSRVSGPAPGSSSGADLFVGVAGIEPLEVRLDELRQLMADHLAETSRIGRIITRTVNTPIRWYRPRVILSCWSVWLVSFGRAFLTCSCPSATSSVVGVHP